MKFMMACIWAGSLAAAVAVASDTAHASRNKQAAPTVILTMEDDPAGNRPGTIWRYFETWQTDVCRTQSGELVRVDPFDPRLYESPTGEWVSVKRDYFDGFAPRKTYRIKPAKVVRESSPPPAGWQQPQFDDSGWARQAGQALFSYRALSLMCLRGKFEVCDPEHSGDMSLSVVFRGGAVVYLNGKELARASMPAGAVTPETLAEDYAPETCLRPDGHLILQACDGGRVHCHRWNVDRMPKDKAEAMMKTVQQRYAQRSRTLETRIPCTLLRKGVNILAVEIHRAAAPEIMFTTDTRFFAYSLENLRINYWWDRTALESLKLSATDPVAAVVPNVSPAKRVQVQSQAAFMSVHPACYNDPNEAPAPIRLCGLRNGAYGGQVIVTSSDPIRGLKAAVTDLKGADVISFPRDAGSNKNWGGGVYAYSPPAAYRLFPAQTLLNGHGGPDGRRPELHRHYTRHGFGQMGADFWPVLKDRTGRGNDQLLCLRYCPEGSTGFQCSVPLLLAPGRQGPVATARSQMLREGLQEAEARVLIQDALLDQADRLGPDLARQCKEVCDQHTRMLRYFAEFQYDGAMSPQMIEEQSVKLYQLAGEVASRLRKPRRTSGYGRNKESNP
ncbi:MAG: hypothetical protein ABSG68_19915 [Thermoguttaceae bacterium]|jgi:hypothetical protein